jgi:hypothetical protein
MPLVLKINHDQSRAKACCHLPWLSNKEEHSESVPQTAV